MRNLRIKRMLLMCTMVVVIGAVTFGCNENKVEQSESSNVITENSSDNKDENKEVDSASEIEKNEVEEFTLYSMDADTEEETVLGTIEINKNISIEEKINALTSALSKRVFNNLPIKLKEIKEVDGKKIAVFDFEEIGKNAGDVTPDKYEGISWTNNYFAGSTGGAITQHTLEKTLLQKDYVGEWIDGIEFTYKGKKIEFDHVPDLGEIIYR